MRQGCDDEYGQTVETPENENCDGSARDEVEPTRWRPTPAPNTGAEHRRRAHRVALAEQPLRWGTILVLARARLHSARAGAARGEAGRLLRPTKASPRSTWLAVASDRCALALLCFPTRQ